jgi:cephalosporin hydroxylase
MVGKGSALGGGFDELTLRFHNRYCQESQRTWTKTYWLGRKTLKCPLDMWVYQEILFETRPDVILETGTHRGGSALFFASMCDLIGVGRVLTVDITEKPDRPEHPRITYLLGSSTSEETLAAMNGAIGSGERVMVVLDANHHADHVLQEMRLYAPLVTPGNYMIVEDTNIGYWKPEWEPGPMRAVEQFLAEDDRFTIDRAREKFFMTWNPNGYLLRNT